MHWRRHALLRRVPVHAACPSSSISTRSRPPSRAATSASLLQQLANLAGQRLGLEPAAILASLTEREQLGSTGFGQGVAIPHGKIEGLTRIYGLFVRLAEPVDYKAIDGARSTSSSCCCRRPMPAPSI